MNPIQIAIIAFVVIVILLTLGYYWYDDAKFKKKVENNFNQSTKDILIDENQPTILDGIDASDVHDRVMHNDKFMQKDIAHEAVAEVPDDSAEAFFITQDRLSFPFASDVNDDLDLVIDIVFEQAKKLKILPEITQFTHKHLVYYVLDKDNVWHIFEKGQKYLAQAVKLVVQIIDKEGVISQAQVANIYQELHKFVINNDAHIRCSDYEASITQIQEQIKQLNNIELVLELYILIKAKQSYAQLAGFFKDNGFTENAGQFNYIENNDHLFSIANESQKALEQSAEYSNLSIVAQLHMHEKPLYVVDKIFDFCERFMAVFESRILTSNKQVVGQREYEQLNSFVKNYTESANKKHIRLGSDLIRRIF